MNRFLWLSLGAGAVVSSALLLNCTGSDPETVQDGSGNNASPTSGNNGGTSSSGDSNPDDREDSAVNNSNLDGSSNDSSSDSSANDGGDGGGDANVCPATTTQTCYAGPCSGQQTCNGDGTAWGACDAPTQKTCKNWSTCADELKCVASCTAAPAEVCNLIDDNCNGSCDEGAIAGCRTPVYEKVNNAEGRFLYTLNATEGSPDWNATGYKYYVYSANKSGLTPFYRCIANTTTGNYGVGTHFYAMTTCGAFGDPEGLLGWVYANSTNCGAVALAEYVYLGSDDLWKYNRVYTTDPAVGANLVNTYQYTSLGNVAYVWTAP